jgi:hypothetical protein
LPHPVIIVVEATTAGICKEYPGKWSAATCDGSIQPGHGWEIDPILVERRLNKPHEELNPSFNEA